MGRSRVWWVGAALALAGMGAAGSAAAQGETAPASPQAAVQDAKAAAAADTREALAILKEASDFLTAAKAYAFEAEFSYDAVQDTGQKLEFGGFRQVLVRRPDHVRVFRRNRDGEVSTFFFDGKAFSVDLPDDNAYVSVEKPGTINQVVDYLEASLDTPMPFADLMIENFYAEVSPQVRQGIVVGTQIVNSLEVVHLAFVSEGVDFQVWIDSKKEPLIRRIVIDYKSEVHHPQFRAQILKWNLKPDARDAEFAFKPKPGAERLSVAAVTELRQQEREDSELRKQLFEQGEEGKP